MATPSNVAGYCVGWKPPRWSFRLRSQRVQTPMHRDTMSGPRATLREVTIATGNLRPSISSGVRIDFDSTHHRAALRPNKARSRRRRPNLVGGGRHQLRPPARRRPPTVHSTCLPDQFSALGFPNQTDDFSVSAMCPEAALQDYPRTARPRSSGPSPVDTAGTRGE
jgi:hypothetical protein